NALMILKKEIDSLEAFSRRNNLNVFGICESTNEDYSACAQNIVDVLNEHSVRRTWSTNDVERAHRVGKDKNKHPRPLIVRFGRWGNKMAVVQDADLKQSLKGKGCQSSSRPYQTSESRN
ncbi:hypothetical protein BaRGS_00023965, partial [Batillaria attramentaria]